MSFKDFDITLQKFFYRMNPLSEYIIPISGIKNGLHEFNYKIDINFLHHFEYKDLLDINANAKINFLKNNRIFDIEIHINGSVLSECDRCIDEMTIDVDFIHHIVVKLENGVSDEDDLILLPESSTEIDLAPYVYEAIIFSLPMKRIHSNDSNGNSLCNKEMIERLNKYLIQEPATDPRWDTLKKLLN